MKTMYSTTLLTNAIYVEMAVTIAHLFLRKMIIIAQTVLQILFVYPAYHLCNNINTLHLLFIEFKILIMKKICKFYMG